MGLETEIKFCNVDHDVLRARLRRAGARMEGVRFERNLVFDDPQRSLREKNMLLRLRESGANAVLTVKHPCADSGGGCGAIKRLAEHQSAVDDPQAVRAGLEALGYTHVFVYEKVREKWTLQGGVVCLDRLPFGCFLEIEAAEERIGELVHLLELDEREGSDTTYHDLNRQWRSSKQLTEDENYVFSAGERDRLLRKISG